MGVPGLRFFYFENLGFGECVISDGQTNARLCDKLAFGFSIRERTPWARVQRAASILSNKVALERFWSTYKVLKLKND